MPTLLFGSVHSQTDHCPVSVPVSLVYTQAPPSHLAIRAEVDHAEIPIRAMTPNRQPKRVIVVLDTSGSMGPAQHVCASPLQNPCVNKVSTGWNLWQLINDMAADLVRQLEPADSVGLLAFASTLKDELGLESSRVQVLERLQELRGSKAGGQTQLWDTLDEAAHLLSPARFGDAIVVFSDGGDNRSGQRVSRLENELLERGIRVFSFVPSGGADPSSVEEFGAMDLVHINEGTGGWSFRIPIEREPPPVQTRQVQASFIAEAIDQPIKLELEISTKQRLHHLKLAPVTHKGDGASAIKLTYQRRLPACLPAP